MAQERGAAEDVADFRVDAGFVLEARRFTALDELADAVGGAVVAVGHAEHHEAHARDEHGRRQGARQDFIEGGDHGEGIGVGKKSVGQAFTKETGSGATMRR